jgi:hypothetical protein
LWNNRLTGVVPSLPFEQYTGWCYLQAPTSPSNHYTCPLPAVSPRVPSSAAPSPTRDGMTGAPVHLRRPLRSAHSIWLLSSCFR